MNKTANSWVRGALCVATLALLGCPAEESPTTPAPAPSTTTDLAVPAGDVAQLWLKECTQCHGGLGEGDGEMSKSLRQWPRDFTDPKWQTSIDDTKLKAVIVDGGPAAGLSEEMPAFPQLKGKDAELNALVAHIRGLERPRDKTEPKKE